MDVQSPHSNVGFISASPVQCQTLSRDMALEVHAQVALLRGLTTKAQLESGRSQAQGSTALLAAKPRYLLPFRQQAGERATTLVEAASKCCALTEQKPLVVQG